MQVSVLVAVIMAFIAGVTLILLLGRAMWFTRGDGQALQRQVSDLVSHINGDLKEIKQDIRRLADKIGA